MIMDTRIKLSNITPETWAALKISNPYHIPLAAEHDMGWHDLVTSTYDSEESIILHLESIGSPEAILYSQSVTYEGYKSVYRYQLDSPEMRRVDKFNQKLCNALGLYSLKRGRSKSRCPGIEIGTILPTSCTGPLHLNNDIHVFIYYRLRGSLISYNVQLRTFKTGKKIGELTAEFTTHKLRHIRDVLNKLKAITT